MATMLILHLALLGLLCLTVSAQPACQNLNLLDCAERLGASNYVGYVKQLVVSNRYEYKGNYFCSISQFSSQSLNLGGRRGTTDDAATIPFHPSLSSAALRESPNPIPVHSLMLSSYLFFCLPFLLAPFTVPCRIVFAMPEDLEMWPYHLSFRFFTMVRRSSCTPIAFWILLRTSSFVTWSL